jgi:hypothetical protein
MTSRAQLFGCAFAKAVRSLVRVIYGSGQVNDQSGFA